MISSHAVDWTRIDTVLLDMDGTLLDLRFDNWFWQDLIPEHYARVHGLSAQRTREILRPKFLASMGTLDWYCVDYWSRELGLEVTRIKQTVREHVQFLPGVEVFLAMLKRKRKRAVLVTNAHPATLAIKNQHVDLRQYLDFCYSTHPFGVPKEHPDFWARFHAAEPFDRDRTLFIDDSVPVLQAAANFGIRELRAVRHPDSGRGAKATGDFIAIDGVAQLIE